MAWYRLYLGYLVAYSYQCWSVCLEKIDIAGKRSRSIRPSLTIAYPNPKNEIDFRVAEPDGQNRIDNPFILL